MGLQKYRADKAGEMQKDGSVPFYTNWIGGPTLALIRSCKVAVDGSEITPRTVYVTGEAYTFFSLPAACIYKGKTVRGYIGSNEEGYYFRPYREDCQWIKEGTVIEETGLIKGS